jgi:hypothetical protein
MLEAHTCAKGRPKDFSSLTSVPDARKMHTRLAECQLGMAAACSTAAAPIELT